MQIQATETKYWTLSAEETAVILQTDTQRGISDAEAEKRLAAYGRNTFESSKKSGKLKIILSQLKSPLMLILIAAGSVTFAITHYRDAVFIFVAVIVNSILGFWQENKAERALAKLKSYLKQRARVIRNGGEKEIDAEEIVPGDIIRLAQGDRVPADARILYANDVLVDESILTGESMPVEKSLDVVSAEAGIADQSSMVFAGTLVTQGVCTGIVCRTDDAAELGKIASLLAASEGEKTPLQKAIAKFSITLSAILGGLTAVVFVLGIASGRPGSEMFLTAVAIAVSAIPEGLPVSMTVILAIGVERMAKRKGVVRRLTAAEALGSTTVILTDKTGTLTMAHMTLADCVPIGMPEKALLSRALMNADVRIENPNDDPEKWRMNGRIMETALVRAAAARGIMYQQGAANTLRSMPFNAVHKFSASLVRERRGARLILFGAPDVLLARSSLGTQKKIELSLQIEERASAGERVLGVASRFVRNAGTFQFSEKDLRGRLTFDGIITFKDPVRPGMRDAIKRVERAGIRTVIMTGDHRGTAVAVALEVGMEVPSEAVLDAAELATLSDNALQARLPALRVVSRVTPADKMRIVSLFQMAGEAVAMTGDGVNDAPSIKQANVGIAMGSGTEVAQNVADLVLLDDNFETIVAAIEEGRQIIGNIRKVLVYLLSNVTDGLILIGGSILVGMPLPLNALQILWVNFFTDSFPAVGFAFEKDADGLPRRAVKEKRMELFSPLMKFLVFAIGLSTSALLFIVYILLLRAGFDETLVRTFIFAAFGTYTLIMAFSLRSLHAPIFSYRIFSNRYLTNGILAGMLLMAAAVYMPPLQLLLGTTPLPLPWVLGVCAIGALNLALIEGAKAIFGKRRVVTGNETVQME